MILGSNTYFKRGCYSYSLCYLMLSFNLKKINLFSYLPKKLLLNWSIVKRTFCYIIVKLLFCHSLNSHQKQNVAVQALPLTILGNITTVVHAGNGHIPEITQAQKMIRAKRKLRNLQIVFLVVKRNINVETNIAIVQIEKNPWQYDRWILDGACWKYLSIISCIKVLRSLQ